MMITTYNFCYKILLKFELIEKYGVINLYFKNQNFLEAPEVCIPDIPCEASLTECVDFNNCINPNGAMTVLGREVCNGTSCSACTDGVDCNNDAVSLGRTHFCTTNSRIWLFFGQANLYSLCRPGNQYYHKIIHFFASKRSKSTMKKSYFYCN